MQTIRTYISRFTLLLLALQLLNLSIYAQDFKPIFCEAGSDEMNITESFTEYITEVLLQHKNAIPEQSQHHKDLHFYKHISFKAIGAIAQYRLPEPEDLAYMSAIPLQQTYTYLHLQEINPPPPKVN